MAERLQVLILEDSAADAELMVHHLTRAGYDVDWQRVDSERDFRSRLAPRLDLVLADYTVPGYGAPAALTALKESHLDVPLIVVTGTLGDEQAVECIKMGAVDYVLKDRPARLGPAVHLALEQHRARRDKRAAEDALRRSELQMRETLSSIDDMVFAISWPGQAIRFVNDAVERLYGRPAVAFAQNPRLWYECVHPDDRTRFQQDQEEALRWGANEHRFRIVRPDGSVRHALARVRVTYGPDRAPVLVEGVVMDVTERENAEVQRRALEAARHEAERLESLNEAKSRLISTIAHELNNPLTPMTLQVHLLTTDHGRGLTDAQRASIAILARGMQRLCALLGDFLDASRLQSGALKLDLSRVDLEPVIRGAVQDVEGQARQAGLRVVTELVPPLVAELDPRRVGQVLANLLSNAIKFTPSGGEIVVDAKREGGSVVVSVKDTGRGLDAAEIPRLFQPLVQLEGARQGRHSGTGLGLYISKGIVERHGGRVWCRSPGLGKGATFGFALPVEVGAR